MWMQKAQPLICEARILISSMSDGSRPLASTVLPRATIAFIRSGAA
jgi:hypothetical protein